MNRKSPTKRPIKNQAATVKPNAKKNIGELVPSTESTAKPAILRSALDPHLATALLFLTVFLILWKWVNPALCYNLSFTYDTFGSIRGFPGFYMSKHFAREVIFQFGGITHYISQFLSQSFYVPWLGALVLTAEAAAADFCFRSHLTRSRVNGISFWRTLPLLLLIGAYSTYLVCQAAVLSAIFGLAAAWLMTHLPRVNAVTRVAILACVTAVVLAAAPSAFLVFVPLVLFHEARTGLRLLPCAAFAVATVTLPFLVGMMGFGFTAGESLRAMIPAGMTPANIHDAHNGLAMSGLKDTSWVAPLMAAGFYATLCLSGPVSLAVQAILARRAPAELSGADAGKSGFGAVFAPPFGGAIELALVIMAMAVTSYAARNEDLHRYLAIDYYATSGKWDEVSHAAKGHEKNPIIACAAIQAAFHTDRLRFELPTVGSPNELLLLDGDNWSFWRRAHLYFDLGYPNMALHYSSEAIEMWNERPLLLKQQALINLAMGNENSGAIYLNSLAQTPFQSPWAKEYLSRMKDDPTLAFDPEIKRLRHCTPQEDSVADLGVEPQLLLLLRANKTNRMAFEYLMTYYLLDRNLGSFVKNLSRLNDFPGLELSPLWQEALVLAVRASGKRLEGGGVSPEIQNRYDEVFKTVRAAGTNSELARVKLQRYANSYYYFYLFHD